IASAHGHLLDAGTPDAIEERDDGVRVDQGVDPTEVVVAAVTSHEAGARHTQVDAYPVVHRGHLPAVRPSGFAMAWFDWSACSAGLLAASAELASDVVCVQLAAARAVLVSELPPIVRADAGLLQHIEERERPLVGTR